MAHEGRFVAPGARGAGGAPRPFWPRSAEHVKKRHRVVHRGGGANGTDADAAIAAAEEAIGHVQAHHADTRRGR